MDTRVLLHQNNKRYQAIFDGLGVLSQILGQNKAAADEIGEVTYAKLIEVDNKLDLIMAHLGIEMPVKPEPEEPNVSTERLGQSSTASDSNELAQDADATLSTQEMESTTDSVV